MCTDAYREALTRDFSSPRPGPDHLDRRGAAAAAAVAESGPPMALANDTAIVSGEVIDQRC